MQPCQRFGQAFVVTHQPSETSCPGETTLHYPPSRQEHEASFGLRPLDYFQMDALSLGSFVAHASPGGRIEKLCETVKQWGKPIFTFADIAPASPLHAITLLSR
jgi:hypothetical protein